MPITPFLRGEVFNSEVLDAMSLAFTQVCTTLGLVDRDPITQHVAGRMVELAQAGAVGAGAVLARKKAVNLSHRFRT